jgi:hypothetical protein
MRMMRAFKSKYFFLFGTLVLLPGVVWSARLVSHQLIKSPAGGQETVEKAEAAKPFSLEKNTPGNVGTSGPVIDFEDLNDSTSVTTQYPNLVFARATAISARLSLNEIESPPHSGDNVIFDDGGPMLITFATPVGSVSGFFTYSNKVTMVGFDQNNLQVAAASSKFNNNFGASSEAGATHNELVAITHEKGIASVLITGAPGGSSFALDDLTMSMPAIGVRILFRTNGQTTEIKESSAEFQALQTGAEDVLTSADLGQQLSLIVKPEDIDNIKRNTISVELLYDAPRTVSLGKRGAHVRTITLDRILITLSGKYGRTRGESAFATVFYGLGAYGAGPYTNSGPILDSLTKDLRGAGLLRD